ncbi:MAG: ABC transporter permease [Actinomycetes bacterium]
MSRFAGTAALVRLVLRRDRVRLPVWLGAVLGLVYASAAAVQEIYATPAQRAAYAATIGSSPATVAFSGPPVALDTVGGITVFEVSQSAVIIVGLMAIFLTVRHTRGEEEAGRAELLRAAPVGPYAPLAAAVTVVAATCLVTGAGVAAILLALRLPTAGSLLYGGSLAALGLVFTAVGAAAAQLTAHARGALGLAGAVLAVSFVIRAAGDVAGSPLVWLSPIGWSQAVHAYGGDRVAPLLGSLAGAAALGTLAVGLLRRRDLGAGLLPARPGPAGAARGLATVSGLAVRLQRGAWLGWCVGLFLGGLTIGSVSGDVSELAASNEQLGQVLGNADDVVAAFLATVLLVLALLAGAAAVSSALRLRSEEVAGRAELLLTTGLSRWRWAGGTLLVTALGTAAVSVAGGLGLGTAYAAVSGDAGQVLRLTGYALVFVPAAAVLAGLAVLLLGWLPRAALVAWAVLAGCFVIGWLGGLLDLPQTVRELSPYSHVPAVPREPLSVGPLAVLTVVAAVLTVAGLVGLRRRDLH